MHYIFKLTNNKTGETYYGKSKIKFNLLLNLMKNYYYDPKSPYFNILKDGDYILDELDKSDNIDELKQIQQKYINDDLKCIQYKEQIKEDKKDIQKYIIDTITRQKYNKVGYENYKKSGKYKKYYEQNKDKIKQKNKERYEKVKLDMKKLKELENKTN